MKKIITIIAVLLFISCSGNDDEDNCSEINITNKAGMQASFELFESGSLTKSELAQQYDIKAKTWVRELQMNGCDKSVINETALELGFTYQWN